jgi:hypothetical protein
VTRIVKNETEIDRDGLIPTVKLISRERCLDFCLSTLTIEICIDFHTFLRYLLTAAVLHHHKREIIESLAIISKSKMQVHCLIALLATIGAAQGGYAPKESPKLPEGFCPKETGTVTATTGGTK